MKLILKLMLLSLTICLSSCKGIELDFYAGNDAGYIENKDGKKVYATEVEFKEYGCLHANEAARLAKYIKRHCSSK